MKARSMFTLALAGVTLAPVVGCMPKMTIEDIKAMRPQRPVELDKLNFLVGTWKGTSESTMAGIEGTMKGTGESTISWEADGWCLVERAKFDGPMGTMHAVGVWTYDAKAKKYRVHFFDDWGGVATGTASHNAKTGTWKMQYKSKGPLGDSVGIGTFTLVDDDKIEWTWQEWDGLKMVKYMDMKGTNTRQK